MSSSRHFRWSDSALLFAVKSRDEGKTTKWIAYQVNRGEKAVIEALRKYDAEQEVMMQPIPKFKPCPSCGAAGLLCLASGPILCAICGKPANGPYPAQVSPQSGSIGVGNEGER